MWNKEAFMTKGRMMKEGMYKGANKLDNLMVEMMQRMIS